ncbi:substrate-binding periplasmic protein [Aliikangiella marina]|uniref:substrate-binding periplasmic protein n=1 Tax=Aliikangiella marina TaxID=1712262 RepID=UPI00163D7AA8|nr:transporter substrate-binding domain-containing protein [Aliikangiella marina]
MQFYRLQLLCFAVLLVLTPTSNAIDETTSPSSCNLTVGVADWPPYQYFEKGKAKGIQVELIRQIAQAANCRLEIVNKRYFQSLKAVEDGTIDFTLNATETDSRRRFGLFSVPYRNEILVLYARRSFREKCNQGSIEKLLKEGFRLGLQKRMVYGPAITRIQNTPALNKKITYFEHTGQDIEFVKENNLDGIVEDPVMISYKARMSTNQDKLYSCQIVVSSSPVSLIFSKKTVSPAIVKRFDQAIQAVRQSSEYQKYWRW